MPGRFATVKALLSATPPHAVLISLPSDMLEESVLRSTSGGTLSSAITRLESHMAIHSEKMAAGRMPPANAFDGGDGDLSKLKALREIACMIKKHGSMDYNHACTMQGDMQGDTLARKQAAGD